MGALRAASVIAIIALALASQVTARPTTGEPLYIIDVMKMEQSKWKFFCPTKPDENGSLTLVTSQIPKNVSVECIPLVGLTESDEKYNIAFLPYFS